MIRKISLTLIALTMIIGCAPSTKLVATYKNPEITSPPKPDKIMVLGVAENLAVRQNFENNLASKIEEYGVSGISSLQVFPSTLDVNREQTSKLERMVKEKGIEFVLVVVLLDAKEETRYVQGQSYYTPTYGGAWGYGWGGYYYGGYARVNEPGYYKESTTYFLESRLYQVGQENVLWAGQTQTTDPSSVNTFSNEIRETIVPKMMKDMGWEKKKK
mgnify:FL=1